MMESTNFMRGLNCENSESASRTWKGAARQVEGGKVHSLLKLTIQDLSILWKITLIINIVQ